MLRAMVRRALLSSGIKCATWLCATRLCATWLCATWLLRQEPVSRILPLDNEVHAMQSVCFQLSDIAFALRNVHDLANVAIRFSTSGPRVICKDESVYGKICQTVDKVAYAVYSLFGIQAASPEVITADDT